MNIAWIGTGVMGSSMAINLKKSGHNVSVYSRTLSKCEPLREYGIEVKDSIKECVKDADAVFTIVGYPKDVEEVYLGKEGIFEYAREGAYLVDMTTSSPLLAKKLYEKGNKFHILDAPVSGGDIGAKNATLSIMVGGNKEDFEYMYNVFECMGKNIIYLGEAGSGQNCKASNQVAIAGTIAAVAESIIYAKKSGLDPKTVLDAISKGAAGSWQLQNNGYKMIEKDYEPGFFNKHFIKDMKIAKEVMDEKGESLPVLNKVLEMYEELAKKNFEDKGTQSIIEEYL
ncbi:NAD(P)-dependent oxidoreductase [Clostridium celatum]|uniref:Phosphogluconate dehydrogenase, NAD binding domain protein n=1 Tax=Clostridium celatum DSM 1785 TaxID=545697 RepID=L1QCT6_9CLOT|nr:NAD(P)-dependent oxidoreductase [Clostridium celatum]EKY25779.1 phosphogluconate dehydrogenase, NAD binding domain protein [Clostridium celatum DSM 1785]MCE9653693.1 NAD(P)-dependent oxidoreductase [Clostridium celatum]MDU2265373.1 NAD(P)-dependent oxidoreductase [Clostridium celatum]MDU3722577.1 NAD(P)-dependent oxidoreductase [Clostridium celatum]MDU6295005.1 NAD(P)-dependent oxidoreductase [Clostridium celatum]